MYNPATSGSSTKLHNYSDGNTSRSVMRIEGRGGRLYQDDLYTYKYDLEGRLIEKIAVPMRTVDESESARIERSDLNGSGDHWSARDGNYTRVPSDPPEQLQASLNGVWIKATFLTMPAGVYDLWATWKVPASDPAGKGKYLDSAGKSIGTVDFSQAPSVSHGDVNWTRVGTVTVAQRGDVEVTLHRATQSPLGSVVIFDALRLTVQDSKVTYDWDHKGRLLDVSTWDHASQPVEQVRYGYDALGRKTGRKSENLRTAHTEASGYYYDGGAVLAQFRLGDGKITHSNLLGPGAGEVLAMDMAGQTIWTFADAQGSVRTVALDGDGPANWKIVHRALNEFGRGEGAVGDIDVPLYAVNPFI
jgi:hypothetical protein